MIFSDWKRICARFYLLNYICITVGDQEVEVVISLTVETCMDSCNGFNDAFVEGDGIIVEIYLSSVSNRQTIIQDTI